MGFLNNLFAKETSQTAYDFEFESLTSEKKIKLSEFKGKVILIVNTASNCGFTKQYKTLQELYTNYKDKGLVIIGVPINDFGNQEPGSSEEISNFCKYNFGVEFPMTKKEIVSGKNAHPFYKWCRQTLGFGSAPKWNFHKYLINKNGKLIDYFNSTTAPDSDKLVKAINQALQK